MLSKKPITKYKILIINSNYKNISPQRSMKTDKIREKASLL